MTAPDPGVLAALTEALVQPLHEAICLADDDDAPTCGLAEDLAAVLAPVVAARERAAEQDGALLLGISRYLDSTYPPDTSAETVLWRRLTKVSEEAGEVQKALRGVVGENPRKGVTHTTDDLIDELLDCAVAALGAIEHLTGDGSSPARHSRHIAKIADRLGVHL